MINEINELFTDKILVNKIQNKLPQLFQIAELESSRAGKIGMQVGSVRENIIIALLIYKYGEENVNANIPITEAELDVELFKKPISIKTGTGKNIGKVKLIWTVDEKSAREFGRIYFPSCDMIYVHICWGGNGGLYYIPKEVQEKVFESIGRRNYIVLPKPGTNPRGVEMSAEAMRALVKDNDTKSISIDWEKVKVNYNTYKRWVELWQEN